MHITINPFINFFFLSYSLNPIYNAEIVVPCGHSICKSCKNSLCLQGRGHQCPVCNTAVSSFITNFSIMNGVMELKGNCKHCKAELYIKDMEAHFLSCQEKPISCVTCVYHATRREIYLRYFNTISITICEAGPH